MRPENHTQTQRELLCSNKSVRTVSLSARPSNAGIRCLHIPSRGEGFLELPGDLQGSPEPCVAPLPTGPNNYGS
eukprot:9799586-Alexandrium_andersonii.AAC.1